MRFLTAGRTLANAGRRSNFTRSRNAVQSGWYLYWSRPRWSRPTAWRWESGLVLMRTSVHAGGITMPRMRSSVAVSADPGAVVVVAEALAPSLPADVELLGGAVTERRDGDGAHGGAACPSRASRPNVDHGGLDRLRVGDDLQRVRARREDGRDRRRPRTPRARSDPRVRPRRSAATIPRTRRASRSRRSSPARHRRPRTRRSGAGTPSRYASRFGPDQHHQPDQCRADHGADERAAEDTDREGDHGVGEEAGIGAPAIGGLGEVAPRPDDRAGDRRRCPAPRGCRSRSGRRAGSRTSP